MQDVTTAVILPEAPWDRQLEESLPKCPFGKGGKLQYFSFDLQVKPKRKSSTGECSSLERKAFFEDVNTLLNEFGQGDAIANSTVVFLATMCPEKDPENGRRLQNQSFRWGGTANMMCRGCNPDRTDGRRLRRDSGKALPELTRDLRKAVSDIADDYGSCLGKNPEVVIKTKKVSSIAVGDKFMNC